MSAFWRVSRLADLCERIDYGFTASAAQQPVGPRFLRITDIVGGPIDWPSVPYCAVSPAEAKKFALADGDIVVARTGATTGVSAYVKDPPESVFASYLVRLRVAPVADSRFIAYFLRSPHYWSYVRGVLGDKSAQPNASAKTLTKAQLRVPPLRTQRAIAGVLGALDDKIELNRRMNETLEEVAQLWFDAAPRSASLPLGELVTLARDAIDPGSEPDERFEHFSIPAFDDGQAPVVEPGSAIKSSKLSVPADAVLLSKLNPRIPRVWLPDLRDARRPVCSTEFLVVLPAEHMSREILYCLFRSSAFVDDFAGRVAGTSGSHQRVKAADALTIQVAVPEPTDLTELTVAFRPLFDRVAANRRESRTLAELRDTLLPKLISGELRVRDAEAAVESAGF